MWICHTLRNELLGTASVSLGSLLKGGKRRYRGWAGDGTGHTAGVAQWLPGREQGAVVCPGRACRKPSLRQPGRRGCPGNTNPSAIAALCGCQSVARDSSSHIKAAIQGRGGAGLERAGSLSSKQSL